MAADADTGAVSPRERYRTQVRADIKARAWEQIAKSGASGLSLNAIAKELGMSGPALYRYFGSRDELITELIRDAYRGLADTCRAAADSAAGIDSLAHALRRWALDDPQRYFLVYGTPVPGYHAPEDITGIAQEIMGALLDVCAAAEPEAPPPVSAGFTAHLSQHREWAGGHPAPPGVLRRALAFWTRMHGVLSLELAGHFTGMGFDPDRLFDAEVAELRTGR
ncbi:TetR/AcrR family transcriptional regulator [Streptomyces sp. NPDC094038]|uniref:TetR/AcrR family transcriptional regulator n=1 Tax=Streptomyces sp. NPDC094038 TaxID=3366055 RepID=UPI00380EC454